MKKNDWISEDIWVNYCFLPDNVVSLPNRANALNFLPFNI